jgi:hypothetical protein
MMSWHRVDLGSQSFTSAKAKLKTDLQASAHLLPAGLTEHASKTQLHLPLLFRDIWVSRGHDFHLSFSFSFDARLQTSRKQEAALLEHIGRVLESAEVGRLGLFLLYSQSAVMAAAFSKCKPDHPRPQANFSLWIPKRSYPEPAPLSASQGRRFGRLANLQI